METLATGPAFCRSGYDIESLAALAALKDEKPEVRLAAAAALGSMSAVNTKEQLKEALDDSEPIVALAAANSLLTLKDDSAYEVYYAVLTGEKRYHQGLIREQLKMLRDKKKMAQPNPRKHSSRRQRTRAGGTRGGARGDCAAGRQVALAENHRRTGR